MSKIFSKGDDGGSFLPSDYVQAKAETRTNLVAVIAFTLVMFAVVGAFMVTNRQWTSVKQTQQEIRAAYEHEEAMIVTLKELEKTRSDMLAKAKVTTALIETVPRSVLLAELVMRLPEGASLTEMTLDSKRIVVRAPPKQQGKGKKGRSKSIKGGADEPAKPKIAAPRFNYTLSLLGIAYENNDIADYLAELKGCELLKSVELEFIRDTVVDDTKLRRFRVIARLRDDVKLDDVESLRNVASAVQSGDLDPATFSERPDIGRFSFNAPDLFPRSEGGAITKAFDLVYGVPQDYLAANAADAAGEE